MINEKAMDGFCYMYCFNSFFLLLVFIGTIYDLMYINYIIILVYRTFTSPMAQVLDVRWS